jgi:hypothetical protein
MDFEMADLPAEAEDDSAGPPSRKRRQGAAGIVNAAAQERGGPPAKAELEKLTNIMQTIAKLSLQNTQQVRLLKSAIVLVTMLPIECGLVKAIKAATLAYTEKAKTIRDPIKRVDSLSVPHTHSWNAMLKWLLAHTALTSSQKDTINEHIEAAKTKKTGLRAFEQHVKIMKLTKAYEKTKIKLEVAVISETGAEKVFEIALDILAKKEGARVMPGQAPPGYFEDQIQQWLESME